MKLRAVLFCAVVVASSCSGGSDPDENAEDLLAVTSTSSVEVDETTTTASTTTTTEPTTTTIPLPTAPYTGLPFDGDEEVLARTAVVVKVDNHPRSRPQTGLDLADMVIELRAEGVTRFMAVYHSNLPEPVGPVRSARTSDFDLLSALNTPAFAYSGANAIVDRGLGALPIYARYENKTDFFRAQNRNAPHNLYVNPLTLQSRLPETTDSPQPWFTFGEDEVVAAQGRAISGVVSVVFEGTPLVRYQWDDQAQGWLRTQDGVSHSTVSGDQLAPANVVILETRYVTSAADAASPELVSVGSGDAVVLTQGRVVQGSWQRANASSPPEISDVDGNIIILSPGQTWVEWPNRSVVIPES